MQDKLDKFKHMLQSVQLDQDRKQAIRAQLAGYVSVNSISPIEYWVEYWGMGLVRWLARRTFMMLPVTVTILVITSFSLLAASADAAPKHWLFPVRIHVTEPMLVALEFSEEAKADVLLTQAEARIIEQEQLRAEADAQASIRHQSLLDSKLSELQSRIEKLESHGRNDKALEVAARFEAALSVHHQILIQTQALSEAEDADGNNNEAKGESNLDQTDQAESGQPDLPLSSQSKDKNQQIFAELRNKAEASVKREANAVSKLQAQRRINEAQALVVEIENLISANQIKLNDQVEAKAASELDLVRQQLQQAQQFLTEGGFADSVVVSATASARAQRVKVIVVSALKTRSNLFNQPPPVSEQGGSRPDENQQRHQEQQVQYEKQLQIRLDRLFNISDFPTDN